MVAATRDLEWLSRRTVEYRSSKDDDMGMVDDLDDLGKLGRGFSSMDDIEKVDIADGVIPWPTYVSACLNTSQNTGNNRVVEGVQVLFCLGLYRDARVSRELIKHQLLIKAGFIPYKQGPKLQARDRRKGGGGGSVAASWVHTSMSLCRLGF
jgi:hypothetical protein